MRETSLLLYRLFVSFLLFFHETKDISFRNVSFSNGKEGGKEKGYWTLTYFNFHLLSWDNIKALGFIEVYQAFSKNSYMHYIVYMLFL